jgi:hypothetical protein
MKKINIEIRNFLHFFRYNDIILYKIKILKLNKINYGK